MTESSKRLGARLLSVHRMSRNYDSRVILIQYPTIPNVIAQYTVKTKTLFGECFTYFGCETKTMWNVFRLFFKIGLCSAISFKRSRRELSIDVAEHRPML